MTRAERPSFPTALMSAEDLAARWQVPTSQVYRLTRDGQIPVVRIGRYYRYRLDAIEAWETALGDEPERNSGALPSR